MGEQPHTGKPPIAEVDFRKLAGAVYRDRQIIFVSVAVFLFFGLLFLLIQRKEYEANSKFLPYQEGGLAGSLGSLGSLSGLAGLAGLNLDLSGSSETLSPELYPQLVQSLPYLLEALESPVYSAKYDTVVSCSYYLTEIVSPTLPGMLYDAVMEMSGGSKKDPDSMVKPDSLIVSLSKSEYKLIKKFRKRVTINVDKKTGMVELICSLPEKRAAADLTSNCVKILQEYLTNFKNKKAKETYAFLEQRYQEALLDYENARQARAAFYDRNYNTVSARANIQKEQLDNEYNLRFELYTNLSTQLEKARFQVKDQTPVFSLVEPVRVPIESSNLPWALTLLIALLSGLIMGLMAMAFYRLFLHLRSEIASQ
jgi:uncharacterized protein involved in exopolysaccharide biosynthesis